jgi:hypothetical protein
VWSIETKVHRLELRFIDHVRELHYVLMCLLLLQP